eukprot:5231664-Amphidinium_carterae.1
MERDGTYGDQITLMALSRVFRYRMVVHRSTDGTATIIEPPAAEARETASNSALDGSRGNAPDATHVAGQF